MTNAYKVAELKSVTRTLAHSRVGEGSVAVTDDFELSGPSEIIESIPTHGTWEKVDDHTLLIQYEGAKVKAVISSATTFTISETKVDEYRNPFTRIEVHVPLTGSGKVTGTYSPVN
jgi:hypothetical protein